jgi:hypothetical protein
MGVNMLSVSSACTLRGHFAQVCFERSASSGTHCRTLHRTMISARSGREISTATRARRTSRNADQGASETGLVSAKPPADGDAPDRSIPIFGDEQRTIPSRTCIEVPAIPTANLH